MNVVVLLFVAGILLLVFEVFVPGGILGVLGGLAMAGGCVVAFREFGSTTGTIATVAAGLALGLLFWAELWLLPRTRLGRKLFQERSIDATSQPALAEASVVGKSAQAATTLAPSGYVMVDGQRYEAYSQSGYVPKGAALRVVGLDNFRLIVTQS